MTGHKSYPSFNLRIGAKELPGHVDASDKHQEKHPVPGQQEALRMKVRAESLGDAENDPAEQCAPQASRAPDDRRFERENELQRTGIRIEVCAQSQKQPGKRDRDKRDGRGDRVNKTGIDAEELNRVGVLGRRADLPPKRRVGEE